MRAGQCRRAHGLALRGFKMVPHMNTALSVLAVSHGAEASELLLVEVRSFGLQYFFIRLL